MLSVDELVSSLVDIVSKNGNLLLDVGPEADGTISPLQLERLKGLGDWLSKNGEAIFDTHPWIRASGVTSDNAPVRFTRRKDTLYAILLKRPVANRVTIKDLALSPHSRIRLVGSNETLEWHATGDRATVVLPRELSGEHAWVLKINPAPGE
jgi:alpha-L-fucosidase